MTADEWLRRALADERDWRDVLAFTELPSDQQREVQRRAVAGARATDRRVRSLAWRTLEDIALATGSVDSASDHLRLEAAYAAHAGQSLAPGASVPGCLCDECTGVIDALALSVPAPDTSAVTCPRCGHYRELVHDATAVFYVCAACNTRSSCEWPHSAAESMLPTLPYATTKTPAQLRPRRNLQPALDVDAARAVPISTVARQLGIEVGRTGRYARCPFHDDHHPSLHLNDRKGAAFCNPCGRSWDSIALVMAVDDVTFVDAVRRLTMTQAA